MIDCKQGKNDFIKWGIEKMTKTYDYLTRYTIESDCDLQSLWVRLEHSDEHGHTEVVAGYALTLLDSASNQIPFNEVNATDLESVAHFVQSEMKYYNSRPGALTARDEDD